VSYTVWCGEVLIQCVVMRLVNPIHTDTGGYACDGTLAGGLHRFVTVLSCSHKRNTLSGAWAVLYTMYRLMSLLLQVAGSPGLSRNALGTSLSG